mmetsp:Transcript_77041/g.94494  ORF Transcript_77041/g.94494 Transcript_77041/m.94494 type:complete len:353 (+) Transcript_77041:356-1414(+)
MISYQKDDPLYDQKYELNISNFFNNISQNCSNTVHTFKLSPNGGPFRLANSASSKCKFYQTTKLLHYIFGSFHKIRKFKMDAYNLVSLSEFESIMQKYEPKLEFLETQVVVYDNNLNKVILEEPVSLSKKILPSTIRHLCLPLFSDDTWITKQYLPNLEYLFFFGFQRSSIYALDENHLTLKILNYIAGEQYIYSTNTIGNINRKDTLQLLKINYLKQHTIRPNCPRIKLIEISLRKSDYLPILLRPVIMKLFKRCKYLKTIKLSTAGNVKLARTLYGSLMNTTLEYCKLTVKQDGRQEKPIGVLIFERIKSHRNNNERSSVGYSISSLNKKEDSYTDTISELNVGGNLRGI